MGPKKNAAPALKGQQSLASFFGAARAKPVPSPPAAQCVRQKPASPKSAGPDATPPAEKPLPVTPQAAVTEVDAKPQAVVAELDARPQPQPAVVELDAKPAVTELAAKPQAQAAPPVAAAPQKRARTRSPQPAAAKRARVSLPDFLVTAEVPTATAQAKLVRKCTYDFQKEANWPPGGPVPYEFISNCFADISGTGPRLEVQLLLANCLRTVMRTTPDDLLACVYLAVNKLGPAVEGIELGIGDAQLIKCIAQSSGRTEVQVKALYQREGDLAEIAQKSSGKQVMLRKPQRLTCRHVYQTLREIAVASGKDVQKRRMGIINTMLRDAKPVEANFLVRSLQGKMRIGLAESTVLVSLGFAVLLEETDVDSHSDEELQMLLNNTAERVKEVFHEMPSFDTMIPQILSDGLLALRPGRISITLNLPVKPMLAKPTKGIKEVLNRFSGSRFTCEFKYDGERGQIHYSRDSCSSPESIMIFSRNAENHTTKYPDIIHALKTQPIVSDRVTSFIMDSEVVAYDVKEGKIMPFQVLQHRGRKNIQLSDVTIQVCIYAFDLLYFNGESLLRKPLEQRRAILHEHFNVVEGTFQFAKWRDCTHTEEMETFLQESIAGSCEGLMVKTLDKDAAYTPSKRSYNWLKLKKDYMQGVGDSLDLVPIGGYWGKGKRTGVYGGFLLACYDEETEGYQSICKVGTGFSDEKLEAFTEFFKDKVRETPQSGYGYDDKHKPDVWFTDCAVWEILAADLSISPVHRAAVGLVDEGKGIALRFPRFVRVREDKGPADATEAKQVAEMYRAQYRRDAEERDQQVDMEVDDEY